VEVAFAHPANARVLAYLRRGFDRAPVAARSAPPSLQHLETPSLPTSARLAQRLWQELTVLLPEPCAWVVYARPVLVHPPSGIIFGFALGARTYALKLDEPPGGARRMMLDRPWTLGDWRDEEVAWCRAAYDAAALSGPASS
jgi:hypothetical protein